MNVFVIRTILLSALFAPITAALHAQAPTSTQQPEGAPLPDAAIACPYDGKHYICSFAHFHKAFHQATTIAIEASPRDKAAIAQIREFLEAHHKDISSTNPDLTITLLPIDHGAIVMGPADVDLATLRIYNRAKDGVHGDLIWEENYRGQADLPWPSTVHALLMQFAARFPRKK